MRRSVILLAILIAGHCGDANQGRTENVIILTIDGPRFSETWGDSMSKLIPRLSGDLAPQGALLIHFHNDGVTETTAGHTALTTGVYQSINNSGLELPQHPSVFQLWRAQSGADSTQTWIVTGKDKLEVLSNCQDTTWRDRFRPRTDCGLSGLGSGSRDDSATLARAMEILTVDHPRLMLLHFKEPDGTAHGASWSGYLAQIRRTDSLAFVFWNFLQSDPFYSDETTLFITHDHGRHLDSVSVGFVSHGDTCGGCRKIACLVLGPDVRRGLFHTSYGLIDVAATVAHLVGVSIPASPGRVIQEILTFTDQRKEIRYGPASNQFSEMDSPASPSTEAACRQSGGLEGHGIYHHGRRRTQRAQGLPLQRRRRVLLSNQREYRSQDHPGGQAGECEDPSGRDLPVASAHAAFSPASGQHDRSGDRAKAKRKRIGWIPVVL